MTKRRFDSEALLEQLLAGDENAFKAYYERYRGRVYRFIARQCGNGKEGQAVYLSVWAQLIDARLRCKDIRALKLAFLTSLESPSFKPPLKANTNALITFMPRDLDEEGGWSTLLVELIRRLSEGRRKRFLFRHEMGLSENAIALIFQERPEVTRRYLEQAERELLDGLFQVGCSKRVSLEGLYRETRVLKPPASWDNEVIMAYSGWMTEGVPPALLNLQGNAGTIGLMQRFFRRAMGQSQSVPVGQDAVHTPVHRS